VRVSRGTRAKFRKRRRKQKQNKKMLKNNEGKGSKTSIAFSILFNMFYFICIFFFTSLYAVSSVLSFLLHYCTYMKGFRRILSASRRLVDDL
jgi:hypothetical protein